MQSIRYVAIILCILIGAKLQAQEKDSSYTFKVSGACGMCKERIEKAAKQKGVYNALWDEETGQMVVRINPLVTDIQKIKKKILAVGHDVDDQKADEKAYNKLPDCCLYRDVTKHNDGALPTEVAGVVYEEDIKGNFRPLKGANVYWYENGLSVLSDSNGVFKIPFSGQHLIVSYAGFNADTMMIVDSKELKFILASGKQLEEVKVTSKKRSSYISALNPIRTQIMTERELFKAACCNLSESFETNPSVDVSYNDAVTGSKQIQMLGLSGVYTQLTVENLPGPRGIGTMLGLNSIPGPWVESIQLNKGIGSVANGYESIAGQINVELKKPNDNEKLYANVYVNDFGKTDLNLNYTQNINHKWSTILLLHDDFFKNKKLDNNEDGFRDLPTGNQFGIVNRWKYEDTKGWLLQFGAKYLTENREGGQTSFNASTDKFTNNAYGLGIDINRMEFFTKLGYLFPEKKYKSIGLQLSAISHKQNSYFGYNEYNGTEKSFYSNLIYQSIIGNTNHKFRTGLSFLYDQYKEDFNSVDYARTEIVPGAFFEYTYKYSDHLDVVLGIRGDNNNLFGWFATPRLHLRYEPIHGTTIRLSAGRGQRTASIFAENNSAFVSSRNPVILNPSTNQAYGLLPEVAWNKGVSFDQTFKLFNRQAFFNIDFFRNDFTNQVVVDMEDPSTVRFYNLNGKSFSNSVQTELSITPLQHLEVRLAYRYLDVKTTYSGKLLQKPLLSSNRWFVNLAYDNHKWKFDYTISHNGSKRIPTTQQNPVEYRLPQYSPAFVVMNAQITRTIGKKNLVDVYFGGENLTNYFQKGIIVSSENPFGEHFDASMIWGPVSGRMLYLGVRYKLK